MKYLQNLTLLFLVRKLFKFINKFLWIKNYRCGKYTHQTLLSLQSMLYETILGQPRIWLNTRLIASKTLSEGCLSQ